MMDVEKVIVEARNIILRHAKPERIWLYGSRATGAATDTSDIDIAFDDKDFKETWLIEEDLSGLPTLLKIDVKNITHTEERFRQRVISTGRVLYSASKQLRCEDGIYNYRRAFVRFQELLERKAALELEGFSDIFPDLAVKRFEFTYEMSWKAIRRCLDYLGIEAKYPRVCFKEAYAIGLLSNESVWLDMIEQRNLTSHVYNPDEVKGILAHLDEYCINFEELLARLEEKAK